MMLENRDVIRGNIMEPHKCFTCPDMSVLNSLSITQRICLSEYNHRISIQRQYFRRRHSSALRLIYIACSDITELNEFSPPYSIVI